MLIDKIELTVGKMLEKILVDKTKADKMSVHEMIVGKMPVDFLTVDKMLVNNNWFELKCLWMKWQYDRCL